ncbi:MAG TPA: amino acid adenylation domain-containing protein [Streptosporangiaceae bacterium]|nr:amino acid adenylation domain-containing protein [Streptosporangiaceae bacterium]
MTDQLAGAPAQRRERFFAMLKDAVAAAEQTGPVRRQREGPAPLSFSQESLWFLDRLIPGLPTYNQPNLYRLRGDLNAAALRDALASVVARHEPLRTYFSQEESGPVQIVLPELDAQLRVVDVTGPDAVARGYALAQQLAREPFDLATPPLWRAGLLRLGPRDHLFLFVAHHTVFDGWSIGVFTDGLQAGYRAATEDGAAAEDRSGAGQPLPIRYQDYALWQRDWLRGATLDRLTSYWKERLSGAPVFELPADRPRPPQVTYAGALAGAEFAPDLGAAVAEVARAFGVTPYTAFVAAFMALLHRYTGSDDVIIGSPSTGRSHPELQPMIGFFVTMLVLRGDLSGDPTFGELLSRTQPVVSGALDHGDLPFERLVDAVRPDRDPARSPLFQIALTYQNAGDSSLRLPGIDAEERTLDLGTSRFDMSWNVYADEAGISVILEYNTDLYDRATAEQLLTSYERMLRAMVTDPGMAIGDAPMLTEDELHRLLHDFNGPVADRPDAVIAELFERQADRAPAAPAIVGDGFAVSYGELESRSNRLANRLRELGAGRDAIVALFLPRTPDLVVSMLAVLKAGAAYLPLDLTHPPGRISGILADARPAAIVTDAEHADALGATPVPVVRLDGGATDGGLDGVPGTRPQRTGSPDDLAYVLYTSGSTGRPKGVPISNRNVVNFIGSVQDLFKLTPADRVLGYAAAVFDVSVFEIFSALLTGARLYLASEDERLGITSLQRILRTAGITVIDMPPSVMAMLDPEEFASLRIIFVGGEPFPGELVNRWNAGARRFFNGYGPTECTVTMLVEECAGHWDETPPIGLPMANHVAHVVDSKLRLVPFGVPGELVIGGAGLASGYLNQPDLTAEKFTGDPFGTAPGGRLYRTGDLVKRLRDGRIVFLGRIDNQVKIRGLRIELGEIESVLNGLPGVRGAVVDPRPDHNGDLQLIAYAVPEENSVFDPALLRSQLSEYLPAYMLPAQFVRLGVLPLNASGKVDRASLPAPVPHPVAGQRTAPGNETERILADEIAGPLLGTDTVRVHDSFFLMGGNSLQSTQLIYRAARRFGVEIPLSAFFRQPTLAHLAVLIDRARLALLPEDEQVAALEAMTDDEVTRLLGSAARQEPESQPPASGSTPWEEIVADLVAAELSLPAVDLDDRFLSSGGHSLAAVRINAEFKALCGVQLGIGAFMANPTIADLAASLEKAAQEHLGPDAIAVLTAAAANGAGESGDPGQPAPAGHGTWQEA